MLNEYEMSMICGIAEVITASYPEYKTYVGSIIRAARNASNEFVAVIKAYDSMDASKSLEENIQLMKKGRKLEKIAAGSLEWAVRNQADMKEQIRKSKYK